MKKESFLLYNNFYEPIKHLDDKKLGQLFRAIYEYQVNGEIIDLDSDVKMAFDFFKNQLDVDSEKYKKIVVSLKAEKLLYNGAKIYEYFYKNEENAAEGETVAVYDSKNNIAGLYKVVFDEEKQKMCVKPVTILL